MAKVDCRAFNHADWSLNDAQDCRLQGYLRSREESPMKVRDFNSSALHLTLQKLQEDWWENLREFTVLSQWAKVISVGVKMESNTVSVCTASRRPMVYGRSLLHL